MDCVERGPGPSSHFLATKRSERAPIHTATERMPDEVLVGGILAPVVQVETAPPLRPEIWHVELIGNEMLDEMKSGVFDVGLLYKYLERCYVSGGFGAMFALLNWYLGVKQDWTDKPPDAALFWSIEVTELRTLFDKHFEIPTSGRRSDSDVLDRNGFYWRILLETGRLSKEEQDELGIQKRDVFLIPQKIREQLKKPLGVIAKSKVSPEFKERARNALVNELYIKYLDYLLGNSCGGLFPDIMRIIPKKPWKECLKPVSKQSFDLGPFGSRMVGELFSRFSGTSASSYPKKLKRALDDRNIGILCRFFDALLNQDLVGVGMGENYPLSDGKFQAFFDIVARGDGRSIRPDGGAHKSRQQYSTVEGAQLSLGIVGGAIGPLGKLYEVHKELDKLMDPIPVPEQELDALEKALHAYPLSAEALAGGGQEMDALNAFAQRADAIQATMDGFSLEARERELRSVIDDSKDLFDAYERYEGQYSMVVDRYLEVANSMLGHMTTLYAAIPSDSLANEIELLESRVTLVNLRRTPVRERGADYSGTEGVLLGKINRLNSLLAGSRKTPLHTRIKTLVRSLTIPNPSAAALIRNAGEFERVGGVKREFESELYNLQISFGRLKEHIEAVKKLLYVAAIQYNQQLLRLNFVQSLITGNTILTAAMGAGLSELQASLDGGASYSQLMATLQAVEDGNSETEGDRGVLAHLASFFGGKDSIVYKEVFGTEVKEGAEGDPTAYQTVVSNIDQLFKMVADASASQSLTPQPKGQLARGVDRARMQRIMDHVKQNKLLAEYKFALVMQSYYDEFLSLWDQGVEAVRQAKITEMAKAFTKTIDTQMTGVQDRHEAELKDLLELGTPAQEVEAKRLDAIHNIKAQIEAKRKELVVGSGTTDFDVLDGVRDALVAKYATLSLDGMAHGEEQVFAEGHLQGRAESPEPLSVFPEIKGVPSLTVQGSHSGAVPEPGPTAGVDLAVDTGAVPPLRNFEPVAAAASPKAQRVVSQERLKSVPDFTHKESISAQPVVFDDQDALDLTPTTTDPTSKAIGIGPRYKTLLEAYATGGRGAVTTKQAFALLLETQRAELDSILPELKGLSDEDAFSVLRESETQYVVLMRDFIQKRIDVESRIRNLTIEAKSLLNRPEVQRYQQTGRVDPAKRHLVNAARDKVLELGELVWQEVYNPENEQAIVPHLFAIYEQELADETDPAKQKEIKGAMLKLKQALESAKTNFYSQIKYAQDLRQKQDSGVAGAFDDNASVRMMVLNASVVQSVSDVITYMRSFKDTAFTRQYADFETGQFMPDFVSFYQRPDVEVDTTHWLRHYDEVADPLKVRELSYKSKEQEALEAKRAEAKRTEAMRVAAQEARAVKRTLPVVSPRPFNAPPPVHAY